MRKKDILKASCIILDLKNKKIGLIYRQKQNDFEFPKGHLEFNENIKECAIRETAEETKRDVEVVSSVKPYPMRYVNKNRERCLCYYFLAIDKNHSDNASADTHKLIWKDIDEVEQTLTHESLKNLWKFPKIKKIFLINKLQSH